MQNLVCAIFARGGSKGLPGKNLLTIKNQSLLEIAISHAKQAAGVTQVFVSTDSEHIAIAARSAGATVPFTRPQELATDDSPEWDSWKHLLEVVVPHDELSNTFLLTVPTTAPLRTVADINGCVGLLKENRNLDGSICVTQSRIHPDFNLLRRDEDQTFKIFAEARRGNLPHRRQDADVAWEIVPSAYCMRADFVMNSHSMWEGNLGGYEVPLERSLDIDSEFDLLVAQALFL